MAGNCWTVSGDSAKVLQAFEANQAVGVNAIRAALEAQIGHATGETYVYLVLKRQGWKAKRPRPRHPQADLEAQNLFKKTARNPTEDC